MVQSESIHRYCTPSALVKGTASWNVFDSVVCGHFFLNCATFFDDNRTGPNWEHSSDPDLRPHLQVAPRTCRFLAILHQEVGIGAVR